MAMQGKELPIFKPSQTTVTISGDARASLSTPVPIIANGDGENDINSVGSVPVIEVIGNSIIFLKCFSAIASLFPPRYSDVKLIYWFHLSFYTACHKTMFTLSEITSVRFRCMMQTKGPWFVKYR